jgi:hypothetical protein
MSDPFDLKVLVKQVLTDPQGLNLPTRPSTAIIVGNAIGDKGNRTGVFGHSERSIAIYGESSVFAGFFQGDVYITDDLECDDAHIGGSLTVAGTVNGRSMGQLFGQLDGLQGQLQQLQQQLAEADQGPTNFGAPIRSPVTRPSLSVRQLRDEELAGNTNSASRYFQAQGSGFLPRTSIALRFFNTTHSQFNDVEGPGFPPRHAVMSDPNGAFSSVTVPITCNPGDALQVAASDGRGDSNDHSSSLWSNSVSIVVS